MSERYFDDWSTAVTGRIDGGLSRATVIEAERALKAEEAALDAAKELADGE